MESDLITNPENVSTSAESGDSVTASPRPWHVSDGLFDRYSTGHRDIVDANGEFVAVRVSSADAALIVNGVNLKTRIDEAMADEAGYLHPVVLDGKPMVCVTPPPSEAEEIRMHRECETRLLVERKLFRRCFHEAEERNDQLRDIVSRLANMAETTIPDAMENWCGFASGRVEFEREAYALLREARAAIGEGRQ